MKDELSGKLKTEITALKPKTYIYLTDIYLSRKNKLYVYSVRKNHKEPIKNNELILKLQQRFRSEKHNVLTEEVYKIALSANDDKRIQSIDSIETYAYGTSKELIYKNEEIKLNNIIKQ